MSNRVFNRANFVCAVACVASIAPAQTRTDKPANGYVADKRTAIAIAEALLRPVYGGAQICKEEPFQATLNGDTWTVNGSLPPDMVGGVATVKLSRTDGRILYMMHGK